MRETADQKMQLAIWELAQLQKPEEILEKINQIKSILGEYELLFVLAEQNRKKAN